MGRRWGLKITDFLDALPTKQLRQDLLQEQTQDTQVEERLRSLIYITQYFRKARNKKVYLNNKESILFNFIRQQRNSKHQLQIPKRSMQRNQLIQFLCLQTNLQGMQIQPVHQQQEERTQQ